MERSARQALSCPSRICPGRDNFGGSHGCREPPHSAFGAAQDWMDETVVSVEDADVEAETIVDFDASDVVQKMLPVGGRQMRWSSFQSSRTRRKLRSSVEKDVDHGAEIAPPGFESSGATQSGEKTVHHLGQKLYTSSIDAILAPATSNGLPLAKLSNDSFFLGVLQFHQ